MIDNTPCYTVSDQTSIAHPTNKDNLEASRLTETIIRFSIPRLGGRSLHALSDSGNGKHYYHVSHYTSTRACKEYGNP